MPAEVASEEVAEHFQNVFQSLVGGMGDFPSGGARARQGGFQRDG